MCVAATHRADLGCSRLDGVENRVSGGALTMTPSPWMVRTTARNRVGNQLARTPVANPRRRRSQRLHTRFTHFDPHAANRSPTQARPVSRRTLRQVTMVWLGRSDCSRRDTRPRVKRLGSGPIGGGGDSPLTHRAPGYRHDCSRSRGSHQPPPSSSARARTSRFSAATNRSEVPATPSSLRLGAPVSRRYGHVEDALVPDQRSHHDLAFVDRPPSVSANQDDHHFVLAARQVLERGLGNRRGIRSIERHHAASIESA